MPLKVRWIHAGHYRLIDEILRQKKNGLQSVIFTFFPSATVYFGSEDAEELTTREEKRRSLNGWALMFW